MASEKSSKANGESGRSHVYFDIEIGSHKEGRVTFELVGTMTFLRDCRFEFH